MKQLIYQATIDMIVKSDVEDTDELKTKEEIDQEVKETLDKYINYDKSKYDITINSNLEVK